MAGLVLGGVGMAPVGGAATREGAEEELLGSAAWTVRPDPGDLLRLVGPPGRPADLYGVANDGVVRPLPTPDWRFAREEEGPEAWMRGRSWPEAWETCTDGRWMLHAVGDLVPREDLVRTAVAVARLAEASARRPGKAKGLAALGAAEAWLRGEGDARVRHASQDAAEAAGAEHDQGGHVFAESAAHVLDLIEPRTEEALAMLLSGEGPGDIAAQKVVLAPIEALAEAVEKAAVKAGRPIPPWRERFEAAVARIADVVREALPLSTVVRALTAPPS